jgi:hypothetical protein
MDPGADVECRVQAFEEGGVGGCFLGVVAVFFLVVV